MANNSGIYKITSPSNRVYIGQSVNIKRRFTSYKNLECKGQTRLYNSFKKYGFKNHKFEFIHECSADELNSLERYYQDLYSVLGKNGLNCRLTGTKDRSGYVSEETKIKLSKSKTGFVMSKETRIKMSNSSKGRPKSKESLLKRSESRKGFKHTQETKDKISRHFKGLFVGSKNPFYGKKHTDETKAKLSEHFKSKYPNKVKKVKSLLRIIFDENTGIYYRTVKEASYSINMKRTTLNAMLCGQNINKTNLKYV